MGLIISFFLFLFVTWWVFFFFWLMGGVTTFVRTVVRKIGYLPLLIVVTIQKGYPSVFVIKNYIDNSGSTGGDTF